MSAKARVERDGHRWVAIIFRNASSTLDEGVRLTVGGTLAEPDSTTEVSVGELRESSKWTALSASMSRTLPMTGAPVTIGDVFQVRRGIATGANNQFVLTDDRLLELAVDRRWVRPVIPRSRLLM